MRIDLALLEKSIAVVIDVLRASTTIVTALANGCQEIIPVAKVQDAQKIAALKSQQGEKILLCGERNGIKISGFDLGNSPREYSAESVAGKTLVFTTSNGTRALERAVSAKQIYVLSLLNFRAVSDLLCEKTEDIVIFCSGSNGREAIEDSVCAGMLCEKMKGCAGNSIILNAAAKSATHLAQEHSNDLFAMLRKSKHGAYLIDQGFSADLEICAGLNTQSVVPVVQDGLIHKQCDEPLRVPLANGKT